MKGSQIRYIFFDFDNTITVEPSWLPITHALGGSVETHKKIHRQFVDGDISYDLAVNTISDLLKSNGPVTKERFINACESVPIRDDVVYTLQTLSSKYTLGLISSTYDICLENFASKHNISVVLADTKTFWTPEGIFEKFSYTKDYGEWKLKSLLEFCSNKKLTIDEIGFVGDGENDLELFKNIKNSYCMVTNNNIEVQKIAPSVIRKFSEILRFF